MNSWQKLICEIAPLLLILIGKFKLDTLLIEGCVEVIDSVCVPLTVPIEKLVLLGSQRSKFHSGLLQKVLLLTLFKSFHFLSFDVLQLA